MTVSEQLQSCDHAEVIIAISGHNNKDSLRNYIGLSSSEQRASSGILSDALSGRLH